MDDEDDDCTSEMNGWHGAITERVTDHVNGTNLVFCKVDSYYFADMNLQYDGSSTERDYYTYAVLKLGTSCPSGSNEIARHLDNEDDNNQNSFSGSISPNISNTNTQLYFCVFLPNVSGAGFFPNLGAGLGYDYGVFGGGSRPPAGSGKLLWYSETGNVYTDDEDDDNNDETSLGSISSYGTAVNNCCLTTNATNTNFYVAHPNASGPTTARIAVPSISTWSMIVMSFFLMGSGCYLIGLRGFRRVW